MRDPDRIHPIPSHLMLAAIERDWRKHRDQRLGQLLVNLLRLNRMDQDDEGQALCAVEDAELLGWLHPDTDAERRYTEHEGTKRQVGWARRMQSDHRQGEEDDR